MKKIITLFTLLLFIATTVADDEKIGVAVTISPVAEFVEQIGGDRVAVTVMVPPGGNPHTYEPTPGQFKTLSRARLYVKVGSGIEFELSWLGKILAVNRHLSVCDAGQGIRLIGMKKHHHRKDGHRHEDAHDPHIWMSLANAAIMAGNIRDSLIALDPQHEANYRTNAERYIAQLGALKTRIADEMKKVPNRNFMVFHPAFGYFADEFDLQQIPVEAGGKEPSARDITRLIKKAQAEKIKVIFAEPQFSLKSAQTIAAAIGGQVALIDPLAGNYLENIERMALAVIGALK